MQAVHESVNAIPTTNHNVKYFLVYKTYSLKFLTVHTQFRSINHEISS